MDYGTCICLHSAQCYHTSLGMITLTMPAGALYTWQTCNHCPSPSCRNSGKVNFLSREVTPNSTRCHQSQEWLDGTGKSGGGIVGITKTPSALSRWVLSYNLRSHVAAETRAMLSMENSASNRGQSEG